MGRRNGGPYSYAYSDGMIPSVPVDMRAKESNIRYYVRKWLGEMQSMLRFSGLPESIPEREMIRLLQINGFALLPDPKLLPEGKPYAFFGGLGGEPDAYYMPTIATISNPYLDLFGTFKIHEDVVLVRHDSYNMGLIPILCHYATQVVETDLSLYIASILSRAPVHISAQGDRSKASADDYLKNLELGKLGAIFESGFLDGIKATPGTSGQSNAALTNLIELRQYLKASRWNDLGLNANYNMKRESINEAEAQMNNDALTPWSEDVVRTIQTGLDEYNEKYGYNIRVELSGAWGVKERQIEASVDMMEQQAEGGPEDDSERSDETPETESV